MESGVLFLRSKVEERSEGEHAMEHEHSTPLDNSEFGSSTGDVRENDPALAGYTPEDRLFRSHFQHANRFADRAFEDVRPAYQLGFDAAKDPRYAACEFEDAETDLENDWLNVRVREDLWQTVRDYAREGFAQGRGIGFMPGVGALGGTETHPRASYADPVAENIDPTSPESPENR